jgi:hypothetical protein
LLSPHFICSPSPWLFRRLTFTFDIFTFAGSFAFLISPAALFLFNFRPQYLPFVFTLLPNSDPELLAAQTGFTFNSQQKMTRVQDPVERDYGRLSQGH